MKTTASLAIAALATLTALSGPAPAAEITASCVPDGTVSVRARFRAEELEVDWQGVVVERSVVGACNSGVVLTEDPLQLLEGYDIGDHLLSFEVPDPSAAYRYALKGLTDQGDLVDMAGGEYAPTWFAVEACADDALMLRGVLYDIGLFGRVGIEPCEGYCWDTCTGTPIVGVVDLDPAQYEPFLDTDVVVSVYGAWDSLPPEVSWGCVRAARIETGTDCAGVVAAEPSTWGALKGRYR